jgi:uncharacterized membrane-anchored protein YhcB (DUF1043 family)
MILRRLSQSLKEQNWTAIWIEFLLLVVGVFLGIQVANWNAERIEQAKTIKILDAFRADMTDYIAVTKLFSDKANKGLADYEAARARGEKPAPYFMRFRGSDTTPKSVWQVAQQSGLSDLVHPSLMFEIGYYYSELEGIDVKFVRYAEFVETEILPYTDNPEMFYDQAGNLKPEYQQNMQRLREWIADSAVTEASANCLMKRFNAPNRIGKSCRPDYGTFSVKEPRP